MKAYGVAQTSVRLYAVCEISAEVLVTGTPEVSSRLMYIHVVKFGVDTASHYPFRARTPILTYKVADAILIILPTHQPRRRGIITISTSYMPPCKQAKFERGYPQRRRQIYVG